MVYIYLYNQNKKIVNLLHLSFMWLKEIMVVWWKRYWNQDGGGVLLNVLLMKI